MLKPKSTPKPQKKKEAMLNGFVIKDFTIPEASKDEVELLELCGKLVDFVKHAHVEHLNVRSHAKHMALGELYEGLPEFADKLAEIVLYYVADKEPSKVPLVSCDFEEDMVFVDKISYLYDCVVECYHKTKCPSLEAALGNIGEFLRVTQYKLKRLY